MRRRAAARTAWAAPPAPAPPGCALRCAGRSPRAPRRRAVARRARAACSVDHPPPPRPADAPPPRAAGDNGVVRADASTAGAAPAAGAAPGAVPGAADGPPADFVVLDGVSLSYGGRKVLDGLDLRIRAGEGTALIGPSGTGKSTTLRLICGLEVPDAGRVVVNGWERKVPLSEDFGPVRVSMVFQQAALFDSLTVAENVGFELFEHSDLPHARVHALVDAALARVGLAGIGDQLPGQLSGGMRKRVSFARAAIYDPDNPASAPELLLFDEPSSALDPTSSTRIENCIRDLQHVCPTYVVVTHEVSTIRRTADRVVFLHDGKVQWDGPVEEIDTTTNPYMVQFMTGSLEGPLGDVQDFGSVENQVVGEADI